LDPDNPDIIYNLGLCYLDLGQLDKGIELLNRCLPSSLPQDPQIACGLAFVEPAQRHFRMILDMPAPEELRAMARNGLREIAVRKLKARGPRMDAVRPGSRP